MKMHYRLLVVVLAIASAAPDPTNDLLVKLRSTPMDAVLYWNFVALQAAANDFDQSIVSFPEQLDFTFLSRAFAIIHGAMHDAAAVMEAAYQTLRTLFGKQ